MNVLYFTKVRSTDWDTTGRRCLVTGGLISDSEDSLEPCLSVPETKSLEWNVRRLNPAGRGQQHGSFTGQCHSQAKIVGPFRLHYAVECCGR